MHSGTYAPQQAIGAGPGNASCAPMPGSRTLTARDHRTPLYQRSGKISNNGIMFYIMKHDIFKT
jgi:hypothetical protein